MTRISQFSGWHFGRLTHLVRHGVSGYSLTEMVWVIALMGVLCSIAITQVGGTMGVSKDAVAREKLEMLNRGVHAFAQCAGYQITRPTLSGGADEILVLHDLQTRLTTNPTPGSPFVQPTYRPVTSSDTSEYRIVWTTNFIYKLLSPGQSGTGILVPFDGSDIGDPWVAPPGYNPGGR